VVELVNGEPRRREPAGFSRFVQYPRPFSYFPPVLPRSLVHPENHIRVEMEQVAGFAGIDL
jgi:hypothetical protein